MFTSMHSRMGDSKIIAENIAAVIKGGLVQNCYTFSDVNVKLNLPNSKGFSPNRTGLSCWPASIVMCEYLVSNVNYVPRGICVELGAGLGLCGITLSKLGNHHKIVCTDKDKELLQLINENVEANEAAETVVTTALEWGNPDHVQELVDECPAIDLVIGADVLYNLDAIPELVDTITLLDATTTLLALKPRHFGSGTYHSDELLLLAQLADKSGLTLERVMQQGDNLWDCVQILKVERREMQESRSRETGKSLPSAKGIDENQSRAHLS
jgi:hypothetical protein